MADMRLVLLASLVSVCALADDSVIDAELAKLPEDLRQKVAKADQDPKTSAAFWSWYRCTVCQPLIDEGMEAIAGEKEKAKVAGLVDKAVVYEGQELVVAGKRCTKKTDEAFKAWKQKPLSCSKSEVTKVAECVAAETPSTEPVCRLQQIRLLDAPARETWFTPAR